MQYFLHLFAAEFPNANRQIVKLSGTPTIKHFLKIYLTRNHLDPYRRKYSLNYSQP